MRSFPYKTEYQKLLTPEIVSYLTQIHEQKGMQSNHATVQGASLRSLLDINMLQSAEAIARMEGNSITSERLKKIVLNKTTPKNHSEREIAGYRDALAAIHENYIFFPIQAGKILEIHRTLFQYSGSSASGKIFKSSETDTLCRAMNDARNDKEMDDLLLLPMFILDFLCLHPFDDGNRRMSLLLMLLLLYQMGYPVGRYVSIEKLIVDNQTGYYAALQESSAHWQEGRNDYLPFARYVLGIIAAAYEVASVLTGILLGKGASRPNMVRKIIRNASGTITKAEILAQCPDTSQITVQRALKELLDKGEIIKIGGGRYTSYMWNWDKE